MNAADQRRLTPWLVALCVALAALWVVFVAGMGRGVHWKTPGAPHPLPKTQRAALDPLAPLKHYAVIWQRPLFTTTRRPVPETAAGPGGRTTLDNLELTGVIMAPGLHIALLRDRKDGHGVRVREGAHLAHGDWVLDTLKPRSAVFVDHGRRTRLILQTPAHAATAVSGASTIVRAHPALPAPARPSSAANAAQQARVKAIKQRIEQRRRQQAAHAGDH